MSSFAVFLAQPCAKAPARKTEGAAGYDLHASAKAVATNAGAWVPTGVHVSLPPASFGLIKVRSSLAARGVEVGAGVIDSDYRGEIKVKVYTHAPGAEVEIEAGERFAQLVIIPLLAPQPSLVSSVEALTLTDRGDGGFGSTGVF